MQKKDNKKLKKAKQRFEVHSGEGRRFDFSRLKQGFVFYVLLLLALVVIVQVGYHWLGEQFLAWRLQVVTAEQGIMEQELKVEGLVTRSEEVVTAPEHGVILELAEAGERVSVGKELARIGVTRTPYSLEQDQEDRVETGENPASQDDQVGSEPAPEDFEEVITISSNKAGLLSYHLDGLENREGPYYSGVEDLADSLPEISVTSTNDKVTAGEPLLKIVDNWKWYYNIVLPLHPGRSVASEQEIKLTFDFSPGEKIAAELYQFAVDEDDKEVRLTYRIEKQVDGFDKVRRSEAELFYSRQEGVIVPAEAVFEKDRDKGVFVNRGGRVAFQPVQVIERKDERILVEGLEPQSLVITRHELVEEGRRLN